MSTESVITNAAISRRSFTTLFEPWVLPVTWVVVIGVFSALKPGVFFTAANFSSMFASQSVLVMTALALVVVFTAGDYDLSVAGVVGLSAVLTATFNAVIGLPLWVAIVLAVLASALVGIVNGFFTVKVGIDSLIVTLGMGTLLAGIVLWVSGAKTITGVDQELVNAVIVGRLFGIPFAFYYALVFAAVLWYVLTFTPVGRRLLMVGQSRDVAKLSGIRVDRLRWGALIWSSIIAGLAGVVLTGTGGSAGPSSGVDYLLPAFAAAFLGSTTISPGRFNAWGTVVAVYFLVTGITGLQLLGADPFVQNIFYGAALILAVTFSHLVRRGKRKA